MNNKKLAAMWSWSLLFNVVCSESALLDKPIPAEHHTQARLRFSMEDCVEYALVNSRTYGQEKLEVLRSKLEVETQRLALDPLLTFNNSQNLEDRSNRNHSIQLSKDWHGGWNTRLSAGKSSSNGQDDTVSRTVRISKELLKGGWSLETRLALDNSLVELLIRTNALQKKRRELVFQVRKKYYEVLRNLETLNIRKLNLQRSEKNLENAIEREEPMDIATARLDVPSNELAVLNSEMSIAKSIDELKLLIGLEVQRDLEVIPDWTFQYLAIDWAADRQWSLENNEDFLQCRAQYR
jgi:outer membrane protein TolC